MEVNLRYKYLEVSMPYVLNEPTYEYEKPYYSLEMGEKEYTKINAVVSEIAAKYGGTTLGDPDGWNDMSTCILMLTIGTVEVRVTVYSPESCIVALLHCIKFTGDPLNWDEDENQYEDEYGMDACIKSAEKLKQLNKLMKSKVMPMIRELDTALENLCNEYPLFPEYLPEGL
jgi:hypothetical protein